jgi:hypothetical protein
MEGIARLAVNCFDRIRFPTAVVDFDDSALSVNKNAEWESTDSAMRRQRMQAFNVHGDPNSR